ncbi:putative glutamine amidotransferase subunit PdxT [Selenomonas ruminantium subsp. lactilytica TAM6421]|uniref:Pyridoxal 5'-phosphate synthase subunit PdxT n=1 Tax=Selenomonas ruminantium subsp. lactilytica (strain NBRC 103574 / TAM6421) TaxID=927704 RepID=I0GM11_SELRL|nr:pyridoxal 5'-phosphate synthase glutaminase subunit PdxT [Selenomonas ruminantium]BAL81798.1 putative glutamine amidotransferase subunit PdxT [Selenomonas ruminantium subsp. lactilytica TAM6421]
MAEKIIGVLALQGAFQEHEQMLAKLGAKFREIRKPEDLTEDIAGVILPGGESTAQRKLLQETGLFQPLQQRIRGGLPVLATCAGLILLAQELSNDDAGTLGTLPVRVQRNAYGRQLGSFAYRGSFGDLPEVSMPFIRAPYIEKVLHPAVKVLSTCQGKITAVAYKKQLGMAFHPELTKDLRIHQQFVQML